MRYKKDQVKALVALHKSVQTPEQKKTNQIVEKIIDYKIRLEQISYACQQLEKSIGFNVRDLNQSIQAINDGSDNRFEIFSSAESNLKYLVTTELVDKLNSIKFIQTKIKKSLK